MTPGDSSEEHLRRVRQICAALPGTEERLSHGEPTFFVGKRVYAMFANNHHDDGHIGLWLPAPGGMQETLIASAPQVYYYPPYVGFRGWIGIELANISDADLAFHIRDGWRLIAPKRLQAELEPARASRPKPK
jgi:hypothetical protein